MIINFHAHAFDDGIAQRAIASLEKGANTKAYIGGTASDLTNDMAANSISYSVIHPVATKPTQVSKINRWILTLPSCIIPFGAMHPYAENIGGELDFLVENGIVGIKLHPDYGSYYAEDERVADVCRMAQERGLGVMFHAGVDIAFPDIVHCTPRMIADIAVKFPDLKIFAAHMGGCKMWEDTITYLAECENVYVDTSMSASLMDKAMLYRLLDAIPTERILFGTDSPWLDTKKEIETIQGLSISDEKKDMIFSGNALRVLSELNYTKI
ncbi:MAG: amidohydrolase [Clostridiales bacterium]|nr:amidohydrolase [Clostridiales bacterium]